MIEYTTQETSLIPWKDRRQIEKKVLPEYYKGIRAHRKMFEIRKDEDNIKPGDILVLREWDGEKYTGGKTRREVTAVLRGCPEYGLMEGYCILSLQTPGWDYLTASACLDEASADSIPQERIEAAIAKIESAKDPHGSGNAEIFNMGIDEALEILKQTLYETQGD